METFEMPKKDLITPRQIAKKSEDKIKKSIVDKFSVSPDDLSLLLEDEEGVYLSREEKNTLCSLVVAKNGNLFLVTGRIEEKSQELRDIKCDVIS